MHVYDDATELLGIVQVCRSVILIVFELHGTRALCFVKVSLSANLIDLAIGGLDGNLDTFNDMGALGGGGVFASSRLAASSSFSCPTQACLAACSPRVFNWEQFSNGFESPFLAL